MKLLERLGWGPKKKLESFGFLQTDMHSHLLPGIDDGSPELDTSLQLIKELMGMGFRQFITTPHVMSDLYPNTSAIIREKLGLLRQAIQEEGLDVHIDAAAEYLMDNEFGEKIESGDLLTFGKNYVLVEMSFISPPPQLEDYLFRLQMSGYRPILAHPERYEYYRGHLEAYATLQDRGCLLQVNLLSLTGYYGRSVQKTARNLIEAGMVSFLGTDLHHLRHAEALQALLQNSKVAKLLDGHQFMNAQLAHT